MLKLTSMKVECVCKNCNKSFFFTRQSKGRRQYCSKTCWYARKAEPIECTCKKCGSVYYRQLSKIGSYCSWACKISGSRVNPYLGVQVVYKPTSKPFLCYIAKEFTGNKRKFVGQFSDYHDAAEAYNNAIVIFRHNAELNVIDRSIPIPKHFQNKIKLRDPKNMIVLTTAEAIALIRSNTTEQNNADNKAIIAYISGRKYAINDVIKKYYWYWNTAIKKRLSDYNKINKERGHSFKEFDFTVEDIVSEGTSLILNALERGKFDGRKFKQWTTQVMRNKMSQMWREEFKRRQEIKKNKIQDFDYDAAWASM